MLFLLPEYESAARSVTFVAVHELARANSPLLAGVPSSSVAHVRPTRVSDTGGEPLRLPPIAVKAELQMDIRRVVAGKLDEVVVALLTVAEQETKTLVQGLLERVNNVTDAAGTTVDAQGRPLSHELVLELLSTMEIDFDAGGTAQLALVANSDMIDKLRRLPPMTAKQERAFDELMARKRDEFERRQRRRRLR